MKYVPEVLGGSNTEIMDGFIEEREHYLQAEERDYGLCPLWMEKRKNKIVSLLQSIF